jgi:hypothetical protein
MFFVLFLQIVESLSYRLEDLKSGTVKVRSFLLLYYMQLINPPYRPAFLRYDSDDHTLPDIFLASIYCKNYRLSLVYTTPLVFSTILSRSIYLI